MYYDEESGPLGFFAGILLGAVIGAGIALLAAPQGGKRTRRELTRVASRVRDAAEDGWGEIGDEVRSAVKAGRRRIRI